jgi:hypothetical protein
MQTSKISFQHNSSHVVSGLKSDKSSGFSFQLPGTNGVEWQRKK